MGDRRSDPGFRTGRQSKFGMNSERRCQHNSAKVRVNTRKAPFCPWRNFSCRTGVELRKEME